MGGRKIRPFVTSVSRHNTDSAPGQGRQMRPCTRVFTCAGTFILYRWRYATRGVKKPPSRAFFFAKISVVPKKFVFLQPELTKISIRMAILRSAYGSGFVKRVGNVIGQKAGDGKYRISAYQPDVTNPKSTAQQVQRSKFSFLGKLAVILGNEALVGMSNTKHRTTQLAFISKNIPNVVMKVIGDPTQVDPVLSMSRLQMSDGGVVTPQLSLESVSENVVRITAATKYSIDSMRPTSVVLVAFCYSELSRPGYRASVATADYVKFDDGEAKTDELNLNVDIGAGAMPPGGYPCVVLAYNVQLPLNSYRTRYGDVQVVDYQGGKALGAVDTVKALSGRALYSKSVHEDINLK